MAEPVDPAAETAPTQQCRTVAHVGDSTSLAGINEQLIPNEAERTEGAYRDIAGVEQTWIDALGGRSVVERVGDGPNAVEALTALNANNPDCYVIAVGTNDAANQAVGSTVLAAERIDRMLALTGGKPVLWPTVITLPDETAEGYQPDSMRAFNAALVDATARHSNLHVYDWADYAESLPELFYPDGIHPSPDGAKLRNKKFAERLTGLATAPSIIHADEEHLGAATGNVSVAPE